MNVVKRSFVKHPVVALVLIVVLAAVSYAMIVFAPYQAEKYLAKLSDADKQKPEVQKIAFDIENSSRLTIAQILGGFALLVGLYFTYENVKVAQANAKTAQDNLLLTEEGKITDRFSKAVEMLGGDKLDVRLGGIYALERIARDSQKDHWTVMEVLTAFVRKNSRIKLEDQKEETIREDIQAAMTVIGRRKWTDTETVNQRLDLQEVNLQSCKLYEANLGRAFLLNANLKYGIFDHANLEEAYLSSVNCEKASFYDANLRNTKLNYTDLTGANLTDADLTDAGFTETNVANAGFRRADLTRANLITAQNLTLDQILAANYFSETLLPGDLIDDLQVWRIKDAQANAAAFSDENQAEE